MEISHHSDNPQALFTQAYHEYREAIFRHCYFRSGDRELALEITQDTFMRTWKYIADGHRVDAVKPFLYRTASNLLINELKKRKKRKIVSLETLEDQGIEFEDDTNIPHTALSPENTAALLKHIREPNRSLLIMRYVDQLQPHEIAEILQLSVNTVSVRLTRALKQLRSRFTRG